MTVADRIKYLREAQGISQTELANRIGLKDKSSIAKIEKSGDKISLKHIEKIAAALNTTIPYLMGWEEETEEQKFISLYNQLAPYQKEIVDKLLQSLTSDD